MKISDIEITVITPTTGKDGLCRLRNSLASQTIPSVHIMLWDDKREGDFLWPSVSNDVYAVKRPSDLTEYRQNGLSYSIEIPGSFVKGKAYGSALRSIGLMSANTEFVTFADDDVWFHNDHLETMVNILKQENSQWGFSVRKIWTSEGKYLGEDRFESVGDSPYRKVPYEMVDNNVMMFRRKFGASAACLYRETEEYNDDRLMYSFLKKYAGTPSRTNKATVNQVCPVKLEGMFRKYCTK